MFRPAEKALLALTARHCTHIHTHTYTHTYTHAYIHTHTYTHILIHMHIHTYIHTHTCTHTAHFRHLISKFEPFCSAFPPRGTEELEGEREELYLYIHTFIVYTFE